MRKRKPADIVPPPTRLTDPPTDRPSLVRFDPPPEPSATADLPYAIDRAAGACRRAAEAGNRLAAAIEQKGAT